MDAFWIWFIRPFAEIAAGLAICLGIVALVFVWVWFDYCVIQPFKRWRKKRGIGL